jgi:hypothetical protein
VGKNDQLLLDLSNTLGGIEVRAGAAYQRAGPGLEGSVTSCKNGTCTYGPTTGIAEGMDDINRAISGAVSKAKSTTWDDVTNFIGL